MSVSNYTISECQKHVKSFVTFSLFTCSLFIPIIQELNINTYDDGHVVAEDKALCYYLIDYTTVSLFLFIPRQSRHP